MAITQLLLSGVVRVAEAVLSDGDVAGLTLNTDGRLRVASKPGQFPPVSGEVRVVNDVVSVDVTDASNVVMHVKNTGTAAASAGVVTFEGSVDSTDGVDGTWFGIQAVRSNANTVEATSGTISLAVGAGTANAWEASVNSIRWFRVRCSTAVTANAVQTWTISRGTFATEPAPAVQSHAITGSVSFASGSAYLATTTASLNAATVKTSAASLHEFTAVNPTATAVTVRFYNKTVAPVPASEAPVCMFVIPANSSFSAEFGAIGKRFTSGLAVAVTGATTATDNTNAVAGVLLSATYV